MIKYSQIAPISSASLNCVCIICVMLGHTCSNMGIKTGLRSHAGSSSKPLTEAESKLTALINCSLLVCAVNCLRASIGCYVTCVMFWTKLLVSSEARTIVMASISFLRAVSDIKE